MNRRLFRLRRNLRLRAQLTAALAVAAVASWRSPKQAIPRILAAVMTWVRFAKIAQKTPFWINVHRNTCCRRCPIFYKPLATCGTPLIRDLRDMGCWCHLPSKNGNIAATCWIRDQGVDDDGWPDRIQAVSAAIAARASN